MYMSINQNDTLINLNLLKKHEFNNGQKNYEVYKISNVGPMKACEKIMHRCIGWS
jgi:hypothetical protein